MTRKSKTLPFILVLDIDGTIIGPVESLINHFNIHSLAKQLEGSGIIRSKVEPLDFKNLFDNYPFIRKGFKEFIQALPKNVEIFFYTAGSKIWANEISIQLAKYSGMRCPMVFSREEYCIDHYSAPPNKYLKSINLILPVIIHSISSKYPKLTIDDLKDRVILVDDIKQNLIDNNNRQVVCPRYWENKRSCFFDITHGIPKDALDYPAISGMIKRLYIDFYYNNSNNITLTPINDMFGNPISHVITFKNCNDEQNDDNFWPVFQQEFKHAMIKGRGTISAKQIEHINRKIEIRMIKKN